MPLINADGTIDKESKGDWHRCDVCGKVERLYDFDLDGFTEVGSKNYRFRNDIRDLFKNVRKDAIPECLCSECIDRARARMYQLRDAVELDIFVNRLGKAINEKRKQGTKDNGATSHNACKCCEGCPKRGLGHRTGDGAAQVGEEHQREPLQRNKDCHVQP